VIAVRDWRAGWRQVGAQLRPPSIPGAALAALVPCALGATLLWPPRPLLLWNASPSSPVGLYVVRPVGDPRVGDVVVAFALLPARRLAAARGYLPFAVPLVKSVAAASGDIVCARGTKVRINGRVAAVRRGRDPAGIRSIADLTALDAYKEHFRDKHNGSSPGSDAPATLTLH